MIRAYRESDKDQVVAVWQASGLVFPQNDPWKDIDRKVCYDPEGLLVFEEDERVVGVVMAGYEGHRGWIQYLGVLPERQRAGIGRALVDAAIELLRQRGAPKVNLQVRRSNLDVIAFYESLGFKMDDVVGMGFRLVDDSRQ